VAEGLPERHTSTDPLSFSLLGDLPDDLALPRLRSESGRAIEPIARSDSEGKSRD
jgi:hypothetical protein